MEGVSTETFWKKVYLAKYESDFLTKKRLLLFLFTFTL